VNDAPQILAPFVRIRAVVPVGLVVAALSGPAHVENGAGVDRIAQTALPTASGSSAPSPLPREAVDTLKTLDTMLARRPGTQEYVDGVRDAKVRMDRYLESKAAGDTALRDAVRAAFRYHQLVATAVGRPTTPAEQMAIGRDPALEQCPKLKEFLAGFGKAAATPTTDEEAKNRGIAVIGFGLGAVLACAADKTAEAQRFLDSRP
jgi:hypothetical protein